MFAAAISKKIKILLSRIYGNVPSESYYRYLEEGLLPQIKACHGNQYILQQDNAAINTQIFLKEKGVNVLKWPAHCLT